MNKIILTISLLFIGFFSTVVADFDGSTLIDQNTSYDRIHGKNQMLYLHEEFEMNIFSSSTITKNVVTCTGNACSCGASGCSYVRDYSVDGVIFNGSHSKYLSTNQVYQGWTVGANGISTRIDVLENTYSGSPLLPNQAVTVIKYYKIPFSFDTTGPTCGDVKLFNNIELTDSFTYNGGWLNSPKYYTMTCNDSDLAPYYSMGGCKCSDTDTSCEISGGKVRTSAETLGHMATPKANFQNILNLRTNNCEGNLPAGVSKILYDQKTPKIDFYLVGDNDINFDSNNEDNRTYNIISGKKTNGVDVPGNNTYKLNNILSTKAGLNKLKFNILDIYSTGSTHGVSGLKNIAIKIYRTKDKSLQILPTEELLGGLCSLDRSFSEYNPNGTVTTTDTRGNNLVITCDDLLTSGEYKVVSNITDWAGNITNATAFFNVYPNDLDQVASIISVSSSNDRYANNNDTYTYTLSLKDQYNNPIFTNGSLTKTIISANQDCTGVDGCKTITTDETNNSGDDALLETFSGNTDINGNINFTLKSLNPGVFTQGFKINILNWDYKYENTATNTEIYLSLPDTNSFMNPFISKIYSTLSGSTYNPSVGPEINYRINLINTGSLTGYSNGSVDISQNSIKDTISGHNWDGNFTNIDKEFSLSDENVKFSGILNSTSNDLVKPIISTNNLIITYKLGTKQVKYYLSKDISASPLIESTIGGGDDLTTLGVRVVGVIQGDGNSERSGQESNFSDLSKGVLRKSIRENAYKLIKGMNSGSIVNRVKYVKGDVTINSEITNYDTLIIKDGNLVINKEVLNSIGNKLGFIVLKDGYDIHNGFNRKGNIFIDKNVKFINALFYSDGAIMSSDGSNPYIGNNVSRSSSLTSQLVVKGSFFTRNTIGGTLINANNKYLLPGGEETSNKDLAYIYDLNYIRINNNGWNGSNDIFNEGFNDNFVIIYNPSIQTNPPKGFSK